MLSPDADIKSGEIPALAEIDHAFAGGEFCWCFADMSHLDTNPEGIVLRVKRSGGSGEG